MKSFVIEITRLIGIDTGRGNGYVIIPEDHPRYGMNYDDIPVDIHGGLTFGRIMDDERGSSRPDFVKTGDYVIGFDTAHYRDSIANRPKEAVEKEAKRLLKQAKAVYH